MSQLLISVRNLEEARLAAAAGADVIDVKNPARGSLGAADHEELAGIVQEFGRSIPLSAALGELLAAGGTAVPLNRPDLSGLSYAKFGLAGCASRPDWEFLWREQMAHFPPGVAGVAVVYADPAAAAPAPQDVLAAAVSAGAQVILIDTWDKQQGHLLTHWTVEQLKQFAACVQSAGLKLALAGSLRLATIKQVLPLEPAFIAVRGAVCRGTRTGNLDAHLVRQLAALVQPSVAWTCGT